MSRRLEGKTALVTAAGQGIGRASAIALAAQGARVYATDVNEQSLVSLAQENGDIETRLLDVRDNTAILEAADQLDAVDVLFNCAGFVHHGTIMDCSSDDWEFSFDLNVKAMYRMIRAFLPAMLDVGGGSIINMSSVASSIKGGTQSLCVWRHQGGGDRHDQGDCCGLCGAWNSLQRDLPGDGAIAFAG